MLRAGSPCEYRLYFPAALLNSDPFYLARFPGGTCGVDVVSLWYFLRSCLCPVPIAPAKQICGGPHCSCTDHSRARPLEHAPRALIPSPHSVG